MDKHTEAEFFMGDLVKVAPYADWMTGKIDKDYEWQGPGIVLERSDNQYVIFFKGKGKMAWTEAGRMKLVKRDQTKLLRKWEIELKNKHDMQQDLGWIVSNWKKLDGAIPGATIAYLMTRIGIRYPWGPRGEGMTWFANACAVFTLLDPVMQTGDLAVVEEKLSDPNFLADRLFIEMVEEDMARSAAQENNELTTQDG